MNLEVKNYPVIKGLQGIVRNIWQIKARGRVNHTLLPANNSDIIINLSSPIIYGEERAASVHINGIRRRH